MAPLALTNDWAQEIADVSSDPIYMNCTIEIRDPSLITRTGTIKTGYTYSTATAVKWSGAARVSKYRIGRDAGGNTSTDPTNLIPMRVQIPYTANFPQVKRGWQVRIVNGGRNSRLTSMLFAIQTDINSSQTGSITFTCIVDTETNASWT